jgi:hypothetical protein
MVLGWNPVHGKAEFLENIRTELEDGRLKGYTKKFIELMHEMSKASNLLV